MEREIEFLFGYLVFYISLSLVIYRIEVWDLHQLQKHTHVDRNIINAILPFKVLCIYQILIHYV